MSLKKTRLIARDSVLYRLLKNSLKEYAKTNGIANYGEYFSEVLCYDSTTRQNQFLMSIAEESFRKLSLDEFKILIDTLGSDASVVINRLLDQTGLMCVPVNSPSIPDIKDFSIIQSIKTGELSQSLLDALSDGTLSTKERAEIEEHIDGLIHFLGSLRGTVKEFE
jgi:hypothetical protein